MSKRAHAAASSGNVDGKHADAHSPKRQRGHSHTVNGSATATSLVLDADAHSATRDAREHEGGDQGSIELSAAFDEHHIEHQQIQQQQQYERIEQARNNGTLATQDAAVNAARGETLNEVSEQLAPIGVDASQQHTMHADTSNGSTVAAATPIVVAPLFTPVHRSWEAFEQSLKEYAQATYQLYVIRTTTSVKRRNQRITDNAASLVLSASTGASSTSSSSQSRPSGPSAMSEGSGGDGGEAGGETLGISGSSNSGGAPLDAEAHQLPVPQLSAVHVDMHQHQHQQHQQQHLIPESYQWYSKTLMCTHGWKDRNRGSGKRSLSVARSTSCPAKMCVTLQHRGKGDEGWQVVLTRHVRTHNHQLSKELYLYYMENRRIYDPDLLVVADSGTLAQPTTSPRTPITLARSGLSHLLVNTGAQHAVLQSEHPITASSVATTSNSSSELVSSVVGSNTRCENVELDASTETTHRVFQPPKAFKKTHASWDHFHKYMLEYAAQSNQSFRARSTVSVAAKNLKTKSLALKTGRSEEEMALQLVPDHERWYSKMLICSHGWRRKSRSKAPRAHAADNEPSSDSTCPAMLMARLQRDVHDNWRVVISRQVLEHNHSLGGALDAAVATSISRDSNSNGSSSNAALVSTGVVDQRGVSSVTATVSAHQESVTHHTVLQYLGTNSTESISDAPHDLTGDHDAAAATGPTSSGSALHSQPHPHARASGEVVVRAPKFQVVHTSWEAFHASLQQYSDATFQLYRTRTTSSVQGRNQKIPDTKRAGSTHTNGDGESISKPSDARVIPNEWKWYSKTLTCTHGWKERRRGTGKRTVQVFRSTACPVKICATVQFIESAERNGGGDWRVVVTKHIADHNHNLSKELHQHYCENRRIYDPDLLTIDVSNEAAMLKPKKPQHRPLSFLIGSEDHALLQPGDAAFHTSGEQGSGASASGRVESDASSRSMQVQQQQQHSVSMLQPFSLTSDASVGLALSAGAHTGITPASDGSAGNGDVAMLSASGPSATASHTGLPAPMVTYNASFPSLAGSSHGMFPTGNHAQQFLFQPHQYFALEQAVNMGFAAAATHYPPAPLAATSNGNSSTSAVAYSASNTLHTPCRVHSAPGTQLVRVRSDGANTSGLCTCFRSANVAKPPSVRPRAQTGSADMPLSSTAAELSTNKQQLLLQRRALGRHASDTAEHDIVDAADGDESTGAGGADSSAVWLPTLEPEIVTFTSSAGVTLWRAPRIKRLHASWDALQVHLEAYSVATFQLFRVRTTSSASARNARITQQATDRRETPTPVGADSTSLVSPSAATTTAVMTVHSAPQLVPESYQWYSKTFVCTHGWKERRRGKGQRVSHSLRSTACPAKLCVTLQRVLHDANQWHVVVTRQGTDHNHELSAQAYQQYSEVRRIKDASLLERAEELWKKGLTRRKIFEFLKDHAPNAILMKDVHNLVQRWQLLHGKVAVVSVGGNDAAGEDEEDEQDDGDDTSEEREGSPASPASPAAAEAPPDVEASSHSPELQEEI